MSLLSAVPAKRKGSKGDPFSEVTVIAFNDAANATVAPPSTIATRRVRAAHAIGGFTVPVDHRTCVWSEIRRARHQLQRFASRIWRRAGLLAAAPRTRCNRDKLSTMSSTTVRSDLPPGGSANGLAMSRRRKHDAVVGCERPVS